MNLTRLSLLAAATATLAHATLAHAQEASVAEAASNDLYDQDQMVDFLGHGVTLKPGVVLHIRGGLEGGFTDNVFSVDSQYNPQGAGELRETVELQLNSHKTILDQIDVYRELGIARSSLSQYAEASSYQEGEEEPSETNKGTDYDGSLKVSYREMLSGDSNIRRQHGLIIRENSAVIANPDGVVSLLGTETFFRDIHSPTNEDQEQLQRDSNLVTVGVRLHSKASTLWTLLRYSNFFEATENSDFRHPTRMNHNFTVREDYWMTPKTSLMATAQAGIYGTLGDNSMDPQGRPFKQSSAPISALVGFTRQSDDGRALVMLHAGVAHASYDTGPGYTGPVVNAETRYDWSKPGIQGRVGLGYTYDHYDAAQANWFRDHMINLFLLQQYKFIVFDGGPQVFFRTYGGMPAAIGNTYRDDTIWAARARVQLMLAERFSVSAEWHYLRDKTDYLTKILPDAPMGTYNQSFDRNELLFGVWAAY